MNNRQRAEALAGRLNMLTIGTLNVCWNTPGAYLIESHQPGTRRIYQLCRNSSDGNGGQSTLHSGTAPEVCTYARAMLEGMEVAKEVGYGS